MSSLCFSPIPMPSLPTKNDGMLPKMLLPCFRLSIAPAPVTAATELSAHRVPSTWVAEGTHRLIELSVALPCGPASPSVPHASAALAISEEHLVVQCGPSCEVAKHARVCTTSSDCDSSGSVQPFFPVHSIAASARGLSGASPADIRPRRAF